MIQTLLKSAPLGSIGYCLFSGWIDTALFLQCLIHFQSQVKATLENTSQITIRLKEAISIS